MGTPDIKQVTNQICIQQNGIEAFFTLFMGDARLNGNPRSIWLKADDGQGNRYLRKLPAENGCPGIALFDSFSELHRTLESGAFYIA